MNSKHNSNNDMLQYNELFQYFDPNMANFFIMNIVKLNLLSNTNYILIYLKVW